MATSAWWVGEFELGERAARQARDARPDNPVTEERVVSYEQRRRKAAQAAGPGAQAGS